MNDLPRRVLGPPFDGHPICESFNAGPSLTFAPSPGGKTTCVSMPNILSPLADIGRALVVTDTKSGEIAARIAPLLEKYGCNFAIVDEFGVRPEPAQGCPAETREVASAISEEEPRERGLLG